MSPEMDTLDQLAGSDMSLQIVRQLFPDEGHFLQAILGLIRGGDVKLLSEGVEVPQWQLRELFEEGRVLTELFRFSLTITEQGARQV